jgi:hypothetical protein
VSSPAASSMRFPSAHWCRASVTLDMRETLPLDGALATPVRTPAFFHLADDALAELVSRAGEGEGGVSMEALEVLPPARAGDPNRELRPQTPLLGVGALEALAELGVVLCRARVALDPAACLETGDLGHEPGAGQIEGGGKGLPIRSERRLFRNRRKAVYTARRNPPEWTGRSAELPGDDSRVVHQIMVPPSLPSSRRP